MNRRKILGTVVGLRSMPRACWKKPYDIVSKDLKEVCKTQLSSVRCYCRGIPRSGNSLTGNSVKLDNDCLDTTLFADIRARYQTAVVQMLAREEPDNEALSNFKARHGPGAYLCRHPNCPHSVTGFDSVDGRRRHEDSHAPRFQCSDVACGFKGWTFKSRAALNKHIAKYHNDRDIASVPTSLRVSSLRTQEDRVLFRLKDRPAGKSDDRHWGKRQQRHEVSKLYLR